MTKGRGYCPGGCGTRPTLGEWCATCWNARPAQGTGHMVLVVRPGGTNLEPTAGRASAESRAHQLRGEGITATAVRTDLETGRVTWQEPGGDWLGFFVDGGRVQSRNHGPATFNHTDVYIGV